MCGRCCDVERKKSAPEGSNEEGDGGYWRNKQKINIPPKPKIILQCYIEESFSSVYFSEVTAQEPSHKHLSWLIC